MLTEKTISTLGNAKTTGERIRILRKDVLKLSLDRFRELSGNLFSRMSIFLWEKDDSPMNDSSLKKIVQAFSLFNISVTESWLKTGEGLFPKEDSLNFDDPEEEEIGLELAFFIQKTCRSKNYIFTRIEDEAMSPVFEIGDTVAGKEVKNREINSLKGTYCILTLEDENVFVRKLEMTSEGQTVLLSRNEAYSPIVNPKIISAAEVVWRRRRATVR